MPGVQRDIVIVGAASSIGIKPYDDGSPRRLDRAPRALRDQDLVRRLGARDIGDVSPPAYRDLVRPPGRVRNEPELARYLRTLARPVREAAEGGAFVLALGGDCSSVLGCLLGVQRAAGRVGLVYLDAHSDFATPATSRTGSAASMGLALAVGRGDTPLAHLATQGPLVHPDDAVLVGRRDAAEPWYGQDALTELGVLDLDAAALRRLGPAAAAHQARERVTRPGVDGFWIHLDADLVDPAELPAVDSPLAGGPRLDDVARLLEPLVRHPAALGLELTIYDPSLDPDRHCAAGARPGGYIYVYGSATMVRALLAADLVDELLLTIEPIILGGGKTIFADDGKAIPFMLESTVKASTGAQVCRYARAR